MARPKGTCGKSLNSAPTGSPGPPRPRGRSAGDTTTEDIIRAKGRLLVLTPLTLCLAADPGDLAKPIDLYAMTLEEARRLPGYRVEVFLEAGCPVDVGAGYTMVGGYEKDD